MLENTGINRLVYEYFEARILFGYYTYHENLPSIQKICSMFNMAAATVRSALTLLEKNGYIRVDARKPAKVTYQVPPVQFRKNSAVYFIQREKGIADILHTGQHLFENLWQAGMRRWDDNMLKQLRQGLAKPVQGLISMPVEFYILALGGLKNGLILNLYWETIRYLRFPFLENREQRVLKNQEVSGNSVDEVIESMKTRFDRVNGEIAGKVLDYITEARRDYPEDKGQIPFEWTVYRQRPQIRYTLVSRIIREIMCGRYREGSYLPSLPQMAEQYGVATSTIRRTLHMLDCLGFVRSYHGKGTRVCIEPGRLDCSEKDILEGMRLYKESLELLTLTIGPVSQYMLESVPETKKSNLIKQLDTLRKEKKSYLCFELYFRFIERECPSALIRECYKRILELLAWGCLFALIRRKDRNLHLEYDRFVSGAVTCLKEGRLRAFSGNWEKLMAHEEQQFEAYMDFTDK